jgi:DinB family protein
MSALGGRRLELWSRLSSRVTALRDLLAELDGEQWDRPCEGEGWSVGLVGCHISLGLRRQATWLERVIAGGPPHTFTWDRTNALNALVVRRVLRPDRSEVLQALALGLERWRRLLERATDADLARPSFRAGGRDSSLEWVAGALAPRHIDDHLRSIRAALASP